MQASPEIKKLIDTLNPKKGVMTSQEKYEAVLRRKSYDHHCFIECAMLRLQHNRAVEPESEIQKKADTCFTHMLTHSR